MQGIGDLPIELLLNITNQFSRRDLLNLRLCAPRKILPFINGILFREIYLRIDTSDDLERWQLEEEKQGVALQRLVDVSQSRIVEHVRVLVLRVARPYSLVAAFGIFSFTLSSYPVTHAFVDKRDAAQKKAPLFPPSTSNGSVTGFLQRAFSSTHELRPQDRSSRKSSTTHPPKRNYARELAKALQSLVSATDVVTTIRLAQPTGFNSPYDIVYPTVYGRALTRLFDALLGVTFAPSVGTTLELYDCPLMHLQESGLSLDGKVIKRVAAKFSRLSLETRRMEYPLDHQATKRTQLGRQLIDGLRASGDHLMGLSLRGTSDWVPKQFIVSENNYPSLTHVVLASIWVCSTVFVPFVSNRLPRLISLHASDIHFDGGEIRWQEAFDIWRAIKRSVREQGQGLKLEHLDLKALYNHQGPASAQNFGYSPYVDPSVIFLFVDDMLPPPKRESSLCVHSP